MTNDPITATIPLMLLLKRHLVALVKAGQKRQTIRFWSKPLLKPGQLSYTPGLGKLRITAITELPGLDSLTEADAIADGFPSRIALLEEITKIYGPTPPIGKRLFRIEFSYPVHPDTPPVAPATTAKPAKKKTTRHVSKHDRINVPPGPAPSGPSPQPTAHPHTPTLPHAHTSSTRRQRPMTPAQRQTLKTHILARIPH